MIEYCSQLGNLDSSDQCSGWKIHYDFFTSQLGRWNICGLSMHLSLSIWYCPTSLHGGSGLHLTPHVNKPHYARAYQTSAYIMFSNVPLVKARQVVNLTVSVAGVSQSMNTETWFNRGRHIIVHKDFLIVYPHAIIREGNWDCWFSRSVKS